MSDLLTTILIAILGSTGLSSLIVFLITRKDNNKKELADIKSDLQETMQSQCRTEMLVMMNHYPTETIEILRLAERYFQTLNGDFYMTTLFSKWLKENNIPKPLWFNEDK